MLRNRIIEELEKNNITIYKLAKNTGLQKTQLSRYIKGESDLNGETLDKILNYLNLTI